MNCTTRIRRRFCLDPFSRPASLLPALLAAALLAAPAGLAAGGPQRLKLRSGEVLIGRVLDVQGGSVRIAVGFPVETERSIDRDALTPESLYRVLAGRIAPDDAQGLHGLAESAQELGLHGHAIAAYREVLRLDPSAPSDVKGKIAKAEAEIAAGMLRTARELEEEKSLPRARRILQRLLEMFPQSAVDTEARKLLRAVEGAIVNPRGQRWIDAATLRRHLERARERLEQAEEILGSREASPSSANRTRLQRTIRGLQPVWRELVDIAGTKEVDDAGTKAEDSLSEELGEVRERLGAALTNLHVRLGTLYLQRESIPNAEAELQEAYDIDPNDANAARLHDRIIQARVCSDHGYGVRYR